MVKIARPAGDIDLAALADEGPENADYVELETAGLTDIIDAPSLGDVISDVGLSAADGDALDPPGTDPGRSTSLFDEARAPDHTNPDSESMQSTPTELASGASSSRERTVTKATLPTARGT